jgi:hypothetical protein
MIDILGIQVSEGEIKDNKCMATAEKYLVNISQLALLISRNIYSLYFG